MSHFLERLTYLSQRREAFADDHGELKIYVRVVSSPGDPADGPRLPSRCDFTRARGGARRRRCLLAEGAAAV